MKWTVCSLNACRAPSCMFGCRVEVFMALNPKLSEEHELDVLCSGKSTLSACLIQSVCI